MGEKVRGRGRERERESGERDEEREREGERREIEYSEINGRGVKGVLERERKGE